MLYPSGNSYLKVQPELAHSSTEDVVRTGSKEKQTATETPTNAHIQALRPRRITSSTGTISLLRSLSSRCHALKHSSLQPRSPHTYTHTASRMLDQTGSHLRLGFHPDLLWLCGKKSSVTLGNHRNHLGKRTVSHV